MSEIIQASYLVDDNGQMLELVDQTARETKLDKQQGVENAEKLLFVHADGNVTTMALGEGLENTKSVGKNLIPENWVKGTYDGKNGGVWQDGTSFNNIGIKEKIPVVPGTTYTVSYNGELMGTGEVVYFHQFNKNDEYLGYILALHCDSQTKKTITVYDTTSYVTFNAYRSGTLTSMDEVIPKNFMMEEGSAATEYEPFTSEDVIAVKRYDDILNVVNSFELEKVSNVVKTIAHRGDDIYAPQCTAPAYILARRHGHSIMENDVMLTEDGHFVMWHDTTLVRLGSTIFDETGYVLYTDGTNYYWVNTSTNTAYTYDNDYVVSDVDVSTLTKCAGANYGVNSTWGAIGLNFDVLRRIDFGTWFSRKYKGTTILTFEEWISLCKQLGSEAYIDFKLSATAEILTELANIVKKHGMGSYTSWLGISSVSAIGVIRSIIPDARIGILAHPTEETIETYKTVNIGRGFFFNGNAKEGMTAEAIQLGLNAGYDVEVWYVDYGSASADEVFEVIRNAVSCGVTAVTTDHYRVDEAFRYLLEQY